MPGVVSSFHYEWIRFVGVFAVFICMIFDFAFWVDHVHADLVYFMFDEYQGQLLLGLLGYCFDIPIGKCYHEFLDTKERRVALQDAQGYRVPLYISTSLTKAPTISFFTAIGLMLVSIGLSIWVNRLGYTRRLKWFEHADNLFIILSGILIVHQFIGLLCHGLFFENIRSAGGRAGLGLGFYMSLVCIVILGVQISVLLIWKKKKKKDAGKGAKDNGEDVFEEKLDLVGKGEREGEGKDVDV